jgi:hypothetical protein
VHPVNKKRGVKAMLRVDGLIRLSLSDTELAKKYTTNREEGKRLKATFI